MSLPLQPWATGPFELIMHAEGHMIEGGDFDRRMALIGFDNAVEVAIATYLTLNPIQRGNRIYPREDVDRWLANFHTKLEFLDAELTARGLVWEVDRAHIVWTHDQRNEQYHGGKRGTPELATLRLARQAAVWVFSTLFDVSPVEDAIAVELANRRPTPTPQRRREYDLAIDGEFGIASVGGIEFYASELLFSVDVTAYGDLGARLSEERADRGDDDE